MAIGAWHQLNMVDGLGAFSMALFTRVLKWSKDEVDEFLLRVEKDIKDIRIHAYWNM
jgi:hypothetical protein